MERSRFEADSRLVEFCEVGGRLFTADDMELWNPQDAKTVTFPDWDAAFAYHDGAYSFADNVEEMRSVLIDENGGRGASSSTKGAMKTFRFGHAAHGKGENLSQSKFPAEFNDGEKTQSFDKALAKFRRKHANSDTEYAITVDEQGYVHQYKHGGGTAVQIAGRKGQMVIHNHPSGGAFSDSDLLSTAQTPAKGIVATGAKGSYIVRKTQKFKAKAFAKGVKTAQMQGTSYDDAVDKWLTANQKKYGYQYEFRKA